jgi:organic hydroperoxide reductase OsmC/OhrA
MARNARHTYRTQLRWTGNLGVGTANYRGYARDHEIAAPGKPPISGSSDPAFRGDAARWNPEELLLAALSACHQLWYLHLCAAAGVVVLAYEDDAEGVMEEEADGAGQFVEAILRPQITLAPGTDPATAQALHHEAGKKCFIARSVRFPVRHEARIMIAGNAAG